MSLIHYAIRTAVARELELVRKDWSGFELDAVPLLCALVAAHPKPGQRQELSRLLLNLIDPPATDGSRLSLEERDALDTGMMGRIIFGAAPAFTHVRASYDPALCDTAVDRYNAAAAIRGGGKRTLMRPKSGGHEAGEGRVFVDALEERLALEIERIPAVEIDLASPNRVVARAELAGARTTFAQRRRLWISGEPGTGKSALALQLAQEAAPIAVRIGWGEPELDGAGVYEEHLRLAVRRVISPRENTITEVEYALTATLKRRTELAVIFDGVPVEKVTEVVPSGGKAFVIGIGGDPPKGWPMLALGDMSHGEASAMLSARLPGLDNERLDSLVDSVGTRPAMIELAARSIREGYFSPEDLTAAAYASVIDGADAISISSSTQPITRHYEDLFSRLSKPDQAVLTRLAWFTSGAVRAKTARSLIAGPDGRVFAQYSGALARLARLGVVQVDDSAVTLSSLTRRIVRSFTADRLGEESGALFERCRKARAESRQTESAASLIGYELEVLDRLSAQLHLRIALRAVPLDKHHFLVVYASGGAENGCLLLRIRAGQVKVWDEDAPGFRDPDGGEEELLRDSTRANELVQMAYCILPPDSSLSVFELSMSEVRSWLEKDLLPFGPAKLFTPCCTSLVVPDEQECPACQAALPSPAVTWARTLKVALESIPKLSPAKYDGWERDYSVLYAAAAWCAATLGDADGAARNARDCLRVLEPQKPLPDVAADLVSLVDARAARAALS